MLQSNISMLQSNRANTFVEICCDFELENLCHAVCTVSLQSTEDCMLSFSSDRVRTNYTSINSARRKMKMLVPIQYAIIWSHTHAVCRSARICRYMYAEKCLWRYSTHIMEPACFATKCSSFGHKIRWLIQHVVSDARQALQSKKHGRKLINTWTGRRVELSAIAQHRKVGI